MIGWLILAVYIVGLFPTAKAAVPIVVGQHKPRCHAENNDRTDWSNPTYCRRWCREGCWHADTDPRPLDFEHAMYASGLALLWPLMLLPMVLLRACRPVPHPDHALIARLEKELGIGGES
jgi:hypothetical protein